MVAATRRIVPNPLYLGGALSISLLWCRAARNTTICTVLPKPISSPRIPPACWQCSSHSHFTPVQQTLQYTKWIWLICDTHMTWQWLRKTQLLTFVNSTWQRWVCSAKQVVTGFTPLDVRTQRHGTQLHTLYWAETYSRHQTFFTILRKQFKHHIKYFTKLGI